MKVASHEASLRGIQPLMTNARVALGWIALTIVFASTGCLAVGSSGDRGTATRAGGADDGAAGGGPGLEDGFDELTVVGRAVGHGIIAVVYGHGPLDGAINTTLRKDGREEQLGHSFATVTSTSSDQVFPIGRATLFGHRFVEYGAGLPLDGPGWYTYEVALGHDTKVERRFEIVEVPGTGDGVLGLADAHYLGAAAVRFGSELYGEPAAQRDDTFWITLPTDLRLEQTRVGLLWFHGGELQGKVIDEAELGQVRLGAPIRVPLRFWGWPAELTRPVVFAKEGTWSVHVVQDGRYLTTCSVEVAAGRWAGPASHGRVMPCKADPGGDRAAVTKLAREIGGFRPEGFRAREVVALHSSDKARSLRHQLEGAAKASLAVMGQVHRAAEVQAEAAKVDLEVVRQAYQAEEDRLRGIRQRLDRERKGVGAAYRREVERHQPDAKLPNG
jgi:hypothetical protein